MCQVIKTEGPVELGTKTSAQRGNDNGLYQQAESRGGPCVWGGQDRLQEEVTEEQS